MQLKNEYTQQIEQFEIDLNNIKENRLDILAQAIWTVDNEAMNTFIKNLVDNKKIIYAQINEENKNVLSYGKNKTDNVIKKEFTIFKNVNEKSYKIGELIIIADLDPLFSYIKKRATATIIVELFKIIIISLLLIFAIKRFLINYLEKMAVYANNLSLSTLHVPLKLKNDNNKETDEIDIVSNAINKMRKNLLKEIEKNKNKDSLLAQQTKMAAMGEMIGNIAHQWRQPLSVISTASSGIKIQHEMNILTDERLHESLDGITNSAKYLSTTIDDFRDFFSPNKEKSNFDLESLFAKTLTLISNQFKNKDIELIKDIQNAQVLGLQNELMQVLINILNNARDELILKKDQRLLAFISAYKEKDFIVIKIKDNAGGIKPQIIDRIFEPYFTTKHKAQGTGIGLYMREEIITKHLNGIISVKNVEYEYENVSYKGAQFTIKLPIKGDV